MTRGGPVRTVHPMAVPTATFEVRPPSVREMLLGGGPRFARDAFGPPLAFYIGWKAGGLVLGIAVSTVVSMLAFRAERRAGRPGFMSRLSLGIVIVQALIGLVAGSERVYLAQPVLVNAAFGLAFLGSVFIGRPLAGAFAGDLYPFPDEVRASVTFRSIFSRISLVWGAYLCVRSAVRLLTLSTSSVEAFLVVNMLTGVPLIALMMSWSIWFGVRSFRRSEEWGPAIRALEELEAEGVDVAALIEAPAVSPDVPRTAPSS
jgi:intracellular septation protein A